MYYSNQQQKQQQQNEADIFRSQFDYQSPNQRATPQFNQMPAIAVPAPINYNQPEQPQHLAYNNVNVSNNRQQPIQGLTPIQVRLNNAQPFRPTFNAGLNIRPENFHSIELVKKTSPKKEPPPPPKPGKFKEESNCNTNLIVLAAITITVFVIILGVVIFLFLICESEIFFNIYFQSNFKI